MHLPTSLSTGFCEVYTILSLDVLLLSIYFCLQLQDYFIFYIAIAFKNSRRTVPASKAYNNLEKDATVGLTEERGQGK